MLYNLQLVLKCHVSLFFNSSHHAFDFLCLSNLHMSLLLDDKSNMRLISAPDFDYCLNVLDYNLIDDFQNSMTESRPLLRPVNVPTFSMAMMAPVTYGSALDPASCLMVSFSSCRPKMVSTPST